MKRLEFSGYSDDTFGHQTDDYDNCASGQPIDWLIIVPGIPGGLIVTGQHSRTTQLPVGSPHFGTVVPKFSTDWHIGVAAYDPTFDDLPIPPWPISIDNQGHSLYSPRLVVEVPDDAIVICLNLSTG